MRATYTGPTVMGGMQVGHRPVLIHGQRVLVVAPGKITYDPTDPRHQGCAFSTLTTIGGVDEDDLEIEEQS